MNYRSLLAALGVALSVDSFSHGGVTMEIAEGGGNVVMAGGGSLDVSLWNSPYSAFGLNASVAASHYAFVGSTNLWAPFFQTPETGMTGPTNIGPGTHLSIADSTTGPLFGLTWAPTFISTQMNLVVPRGYVSGSPLFGTATWSGETLASMGLSPGLYTWTWNTTSGSDYFIIQIIPAPASLSLLLVAGMIGVRRRRR